MNNVDQTFEEDNKENSVKNLNASNEAKRLEEKVKTYNNNVRSLNSALGGKISKRSIGPSIPSIKNIFTQNNNKKASKIAGTKMNSTGSSKMLNDGVLNNDLTQTSTSKLKKKGFLLNALDKFSGNDKEREVADEVSSSGEQGVRLGLKVIKWLLFSSGPIATIFIFIGLFTVASQVYINVIGLGTADALADDSKNVESKINKKDSEDFNNEITDDNVAFDIFIEDSNSLKFSKNKFEKSNLIKTSTTYLKRKYSEVDLDNLEDFYPQINLISSDANENTVYDFFYKMYKIYTTYRDDYGVYLDLPLLMATVNIQYSDTNAVFSSNLSPEDSSSKPRNVKDYSFCTDWSSYSTTSDDSSHDLEVLAQHMVSQQVKESCIDSSGNETKSNILKDNDIGTSTLTCDSGETYKTGEVILVYDEDKYTEFLKEFLEKKYYINEKIPLSSVNLHYDCNSKVHGNQDNQENKPSTSTQSNVENPFAKSMIELANSEYKNNQGYSDGLKYTRALGYAPGTPWCAMFVWWLGKNTVINGQALVPDIIPFGSASTGDYINKFNSSNKDNIKFYYNDNCSYLSEKNGTKTKYVPKPGDYIFFDWDASYRDISSGTQDHTAFVEKYENGTIYTIEGNSNNTIAKKNYSLGDCRVIGFGSWY